jgi:CheY-like chemotaxis protein
LVSNAIKFTPDASDVEVCVELEPASVRMIVADSGPGIPVEFLPHVFERFRQADSSERRSYGGLGLGLAIVRHLVELHDGRVQAENAAGGGARFTVTLPLSLEPAAQVARETEAYRTLAIERGAKVNGTSLKGIHVVLVEDQTEARESMTTALRLYGAEVVAVDSMAAALAAMAQHRPDVLLSDIGMPDNDGYALIEAVRARETNGAPHMPAAAITAYARPEDRTAALRAGFDMHLTKPVEPSELAYLVQRLVTPKPGA